MDLTTTYMGLKLKNPLVPGAGPLTGEVDSIRKLEDAGAAAVVLHSLFQEQLEHDAIELDYHLEHGTESYVEATSYFPQVDEFRLGPEDYLEHIAKTKQAVGIPVIASLNGVSPAGWGDLAKQMEQAGADALELNVYYVAADTDLTSQQVEDRYVDVLKAVKRQVKIPVAMKLSPFFSATAAMVKRLDQAGADGLVMFNRFYQPDFDLEALEVTPALQLSTRFEIRLPLRWIAISRPWLKCSIAASSGVHSAEGVTKYVMAGADAVQLCSVLLEKGPSVLSNILADFKAWGDEHEYESVEQMKGSMSQHSVASPMAFERANYMKALSSYK